MRWHQKGIQQAIEDLQSSPKGLPAAEARKRLTEYGPNVLKEKRGKSPFSMFLDQFKDLRSLSGLHEQGDSDLWSGLSLRSVGP